MRVDGALWGQYLERSAFGRSDQSEFPYLGRTPATQVTVRPRATYTGLGVRLTLGILLAVGTVVGATIGGAAPALPTVLFDGVRAVDPSQLRTEGATVTQ